MESRDSITSGSKKAFSDLPQMHTHCFRQGTWENELWLLAASGEGSTFCWKPNRDEPTRGVGRAHPALVWMLAEICFSHATENLQLSQVMSFSYINLEKNLP